MAKLVKDLFGSLVDAILKELARLAVSSVFSAIFGGASGGGGGGFFEGLLASFGGGGGAGGGSGFQGLPFLPLQTGGSFTVTRPTLLGVGEVGPEQVTVRPAGVRGPGGGTVVFQGINVIDDVSLSRFASDIARAVADDARRIV